VHAYRREANYHFNREIKKRGLNVIYVAGLGHGGTALVTNTYLGETYSEFHPYIPQTEGGLKSLSKQFSFAGGVGNHVARRRRAQFMKVGELAYSTAHAYEAAFGQPRSAGLLRGW
jgi:xylulose-5-phosphate/fructose-6-phosphate phosphoketolase